MLDFMDYVQSAFYGTTRWNRDNSYAALTATPSCLLDFQIPHGAALRVSTLSSPHSATSYAFGSKGVVDGSVSFLYSSLGLRVPTKSASIHLQHLVRGYRHLTELVDPGEAWRRDALLRGRTSDQKDSLLYGRLYLPTTTLEALYLRRISPTQLLRLNGVSNPNLPNAWSLLATLQNDHGKHSIEYLYSTDASLLGVRGLYNFGPDPRLPVTGQDSGPRTAAHPFDHHNGRLSAGGEAYFSPLNKSMGVSTGLRFTTLPLHTGFPYTMTLTLNPLMGNLSSSYAVKAGKNLALATRFNFNFYSYESDVVIGLELWRRQQTPVEVTWADKMLRAGWEREDDVTGVLKARVDQNGKAGVLWEGRIQEILVSAGAGIDFKRRDRLLSSVGLEVSYSS